MEPVEFPEANERTGNVPVVRAYGIVLSRWKCETWRERISAFIGGWVWVAVKGSTMPPILISGDHAFHVEPEVAGETP